MNAKAEGSLKTINIILEAIQKTTDLQNKKKAAKLCK